MRIPRFSLSHDRFQAVDSAKYLIASTRQFQLPPDRPATFAVDLAVENIGGDPGDFRRAMAAFQVFDLVSMRAFSVIGTATRVFALDEQLALGGAGEPFIHVVESPYEDFDDDLTGFAPARSPWTGAARPRPGASTATRCTRTRAPWSPTALASGSGSGRCCRSGTAAVARWRGRAWTRGGAGSGSAGSMREPPPGPPGGAHRGRAQARAPVRAAHLLVLVLWPDVASWTPARCC